VERVSEPEKRLTWNRTPFAGRKSTLLLFSSYQALPQQHTSAG